MALEWYIQFKGQEYGPAKSSKLKQLAQEGKITPDTLVRLGAEGPWQPAGSVGGLFEGITRGTQAALTPGPAGPASPGAPLGGVPPAVPPAQPALPQQPEWYFAQNNQQQGPLTLLQIQQLAAGGRLRPGDLVWKSGMASWTPAGQVVEIYPPPPPPVPHAAAAQRFASAAPASGAHPAPLGALPVAPGGPLPAAPLAGAPLPAAPLAGAPLAAAPLPGGPAPLPLPRPGGMSQGLKIGLIAGSLALVLFCAICTGIAFFWMRAGSDDRVIQLVKNGHLHDYPNVPIGPAFDQALTNPKWESGVDPGGNHYVTVQGGMMVDNVTADFRLRFAVDPSTQSFAVGTLELNGIPQPDLLRNLLLIKILNKAS